MMDTVIIFIMTHMATMTTLLILTSQRRSLGLVLLFKLFLRSFAVAPVLILLLEWVASKHAAVILIRANSNNKYKRPRRAMT